MTEWKPKPKPDAQLEDMNLTGEEGYVLSRVDGFTSVQNLVSVTGLPEVRVKQILKKLVRHGALHDDADMAPPSPAAAPEPALRTGRPAAAAKPAPSEPSKAEIISTIVDELSPAELREILGETEHTMDDAPALAQMTETDHQGALAEPSAPAPVALGGDEPQIEAPEQPSSAAFDEPTMADDGEGEDKADAGEKAQGAEGAEGEEEKAEDAENPDEEANFRKLYNTELSKLELPEREAMAKTAKDPHLAALCFDAHPSVIKHVFENQSAGLQHARLVARNHHTPQGLDVVMHRAEFFRDGQTQRLLLQNTMLQEPQLKRILQSKRLIECYKITISREIPERNRQKARHVFRSKWSTSDADERAGLVFTTEGRCLIQLTGLPFDSHTTTLLCSKTYTSLLLIQNLARFGASPPQVLAHLLKQPPVKRQPHLRTLITQHPNCPADAKRRA